jgi:hypothetical protein
MKVLGKQVASVQNITTMQNPIPQIIQQTSLQLNESGSFVPSLNAYCSVIPVSSQIQNSPISQQALSSGYMLIVTSLLIEVSTIPA